MGYRDSLVAAEQRIATLEEELARRRAASERDEALAERLRDLESALRDERSQHQAAASRGAAERERERVLYARVLELEQQLMRDDRAAAQIAMGAERDRLAAALSVAEQACARWREQAESREAEIEALHDGPESARRFYLARIAELQAEPCGDDATGRELSRLRDALARLSG